MMFQAIDVAGSEFVSVSAFTEIYALLNVHFGALGSLISKVRANEILRIGKARDYPPGSAARLTGRTNIGVVWQTDGGWRRRLFVGSPLS